MNATKILLPMAFLAVLVGGATFSSRWAHSGDEPMEPLPVALPTSPPSVAQAGGGHAGAQSCASCHPAESKGVDCVACHAPTTTYMVVDPRHDHSFRVPRPDLTVKLGVPNACTGCHGDKPAQWAAEQVQKWYGKPLAGHQQFAGALHAGHAEAAGAPGSGQPRRFVPRPRTGFGGRKDLAPSVGP